MWRASRRRRFITSLKDMFSSSDILLIDASTSISNGTCLYARVCLLYAIVLLLFGFITYTYQRLSYINVLTHTMFLMGNIYINDFYENEKNICSLLLQ